jgi:hypothetical protein
MESLEQALADERESVQVLRKTGHLREAENLDRVLDRVRAAALDYLDWLTEGEARLRSGKSTDWLRARFPAWMAAGHARYDGQGRGKRLYRQLIVPKRANESAAREAGRRGERTA